MTRRRTLIFAAAFLVTFAAALAYQNFFKSPALTIVLRCAENTSGKLTVNTDRDAEIFDAAEVCRAGKITISDYRREETLHITYENKANERGEILAEYGKDIQSDPQGFFVVVKITNERPFVFNDKL